MPDMHMVFEEGTTEERFGCQFFSQVLYTNGIFACVKPSPVRNYDTLILLRVASNPKAAQFDTFGRIFQVVAHDKELLLLTSAGIVVMEENIEIKKFDIKRFEAGITNKIQKGIKVLLKALNINSRIIREDERTVWIIAKELAKISLTKDIINTDNHINSFEIDIAVRNIKARNAANNSQHNWIDEDRLNEITQAIKSVSDDKEKNTLSSVITRRVVSSSDSNEKLKVDKLENECYKISHNAAESLKKLEENSKKELEENRKKELGEDFKKLEENLKMLFNAERESF
jgi:hypothetical protein